MGIPKLFLVLQVLCSLGYLLSLAVAQTCRTPTRPKAVYTKSRLPEQDHGMSVIYDGNDSILIFSARKARSERQIYSFNLLTEEITSLGHHPVKGEYAPLIRDQDGSFLYFGNDGVAERVFRFDPVGNTSAIVSDQSVYLGQQIFTSTDSTKSYLIAPSGNYKTRLREIDMSTLCFQDLGELDGGGYDSAVLTFGNNLYFFTSSTEIVETVRLNRDTLATTLLEKGNVRFMSERRVTTVSTTKHAYVFGGTATFPADGLLRYNPLLNEFKFIRVDEMPEELEESQNYSQASSIVFVEKLNRIYFFGGYVDYGTKKWFDQIWYVDAGLLDEAL